MSESVPVSARAASALAPAGFMQRISWGALLAGVAIALAIQLLLNLLGIGIGASTIDLKQGDTPGSGLAIGAGIWFVVSSLLSLLAGGWAAGRLAGIPDRKDSMLHGFTAWSLTAVATVFLLGSAVGGILGGSASLLGKAASATGQGASALSPTVVNLVSQATGITPDDVKQQAGDLVSDPRFQTIAAQIATTGTVTPEARESLVSLVAQKQGVSPEQASTEVDSWAQKLKNGAAQAKVNATKAADAAASGVSRTALWSFLALLLGAIAATVGGYIGTPLFAGAAVLEGERPLHEVREVHRSERF